ncbi:hypothetical protein D9757_000112 [Collybiopsis confluens]|uniref:t-SNARE coiled-coil homology domain-containing protein n=1 Tax=Collybiopsis confluens TaxID=2823264 RepID=A0A8H5I213_9AGAR|nr:hypothetical protein D9757_000112 [Collybiopsis confluens]
MSPDDVRRAIASHEHVVLGLQSEIDSFMQRIRRLHFEISTHQESIRLLKGKITLARRLPPEILASIFETCAFDGWTRAPLVVSHVCTEWRQAAQIPTVWSQVYIRVDGLNAYHRTRLWLQKSARVPISISIELRGGPVAEIIRLLNIHRERWRKLTLASLQLAPANDALRRCVGPYPILSTLCVSIEEEFGTLPDGTLDAEAGLQNLRNAFESLPQLRTFIYKRNVPPLPGDIPSSIVHLSINLDGFSDISLSSATLRDALSQLPSLEDLSISLARAHATAFQNTPGPVVVIPTLKSLTLVGQPDLFDAVLQSIYSPTLLRLHVASSAEPMNHWSGSTLLQWLHPGNVLELLEFRDVDVAQDTFVDLFASLSSLKTLKLHDSEISDAFLEHLYGPQGYCPNLAILDLRWCGQVTGHALVQFVKSRMVNDSPSPPIESITVINCPFVKEQDIVDLAFYTICKLVINPYDQCRTAGCCENERYRKRLRYHTNYGEERWTLQRCQPQTSTFPSTSVDYISAEDIEGPPQKKILMARNDRTAEFIDAVQSKTSTALGQSRTKRNDRERDEQAGLGKEYLTEAYTVLNHINTLTRMLFSIRRPYLNLDQRAGVSYHQETRSIDLGEGGAESWAHIRQLSNEERDQIDIQARVILTRCANRIKEMEVLEKKRSELISSKMNPLTRLLPARLRQNASSVSSDFVAAHNASVIWYLTRRLAEASQKQSELQEERVKRQTERSRTLGSGAALEALSMVSNPHERPPESVASSSSWLGGASSGLIAATIGAPRREDAQHTFAPSLPETSPPSDDEDDLELSQSQILQFENENANILRSVQETLESVQQAEARLNEISTLQMELVSHLTKQTELTDQLYEDAIASTSMVEKGNVQLREARRRSKDSRLFILVFLIGASLSMLFLHYY